MVWSVANLNPVQRRLKTAKNRMSGTWASGTTSGGLARISLALNPGYGLIRQPCFSQALDPLGGISRSETWGQIHEIGYAQRSIDRAQACHGGLRLLQPPGERTACCEDADRRQIIRVLPQCLLRP
jgi:hypothetical protein